MTKKLSRRKFAKIAGTVALATSASHLSSLSNQVAKAEGPAQSTSGREFPQGFLWGSATASYQVEGAVNEDGRGHPSGTPFHTLPVRFVKNATGDVANDHYHLYKRRCAANEALGVKSYRFSIAWPRVFPKVMVRIQRPRLLQPLVDELLANGIQPFATLYHWDLPQSLQDRFGGWAGREYSKAFGDYAGYVAERLIRSSEALFTINEFGAFIETGYRLGVHAPGLKLTGPATFNQTRHHAVLGHGLAVQAIRAKSKPAQKSDSRKT